MSSAVQRALDEQMHRLHQRAPGESQFHAAVEEVYRSVLPFVLEHERYRAARLLERLTEPDRVISFRVCWEDDTGDIQVNRGYRVQWSNALGPYKGGLRFHPSVDLDTLKFLAFEQTFKNALTGFPIGGAKGGADFDPKGRSEREIMRFSHALMDELRRHIGEDVDIPAGDIGVSSREIGYLFGRYTQLEDRWAGVLTGKARAFGGSPVREQATGYGCVSFCCHMYQKAGWDIEGKRIAISGSGNVALHAAQRALEIGTKVVTLSDSDGTLHFEDGLQEQDLEALMEHKLERRGRLSEIKIDGARFAEGERPWGADCDIAMPCATQNELSDDDAKQLLENGVACVCEGANAPTAPDAIERLRKAKILFGPGKAANAGGVGVSSLEQTQNEIRRTWSEKKVRDELDQIMKDIHERCVRHGERDDGSIDYLDGANLAGFRRVADALLAYGVR